MTLKAQYGGEMTIGARLNYTGGGKLVTYDGKIVNLGYTIKGIVSPGYFVTNNIALGADLAYEYMMDDEGHQYRWIFPAVCSSWGSPVIPAGNQWIWLGKKLSEKRTRWKTRIMGVYLETGLMGAAQRVSGFGY